jgi:ADP-ribose pyrophosphatase YjhB (NUDIX family)
MENGETAEEGALRETWEEARARPELKHLHTVYSIPHINQVYLLYRAELQAPEFAPGPESLEVELFSVNALPWDTLAFHSVEFALRRYVEAPEARQAWSGLSTFRPRPQS